MPYNCYYLCQKQVQNANNSDKTNQQPFHLKIWIW